MRRLGKPPKAQPQLSEYITDSYEYVGTVQVWFDGPVPRPVLRELKANCGSKPRYKKKRMRYDREGKWVRCMKAHQPKDRFYEMLDGLALGLLINQMDLARDLITWDEPKLKELVDLQLQQRWRGRKPLGGCVDTSYSKNKRWSANNVTVYEAGHSKETGEVGCVRIEWRMCGARAVRSLGIQGPLDLKTFDHDAFWAERFRTYEYDLGELGRCYRTWRAKCRNRVPRDDGQDEQRGLMFIRAAQQPAPGKYGNRQPVRPTGAVEMLKAKATALGDFEFNRVWNSRGTAGLRKWVRKAEIDKLRRKLRDRTRLDIKPALRSTQ